MTAPKGRATNRRDSVAGRRRLMSPGVEWAVAIIAFLLVLALIFVFLGDIRADGAHSGLPEPAVTTDATSVLAPTG